MKQLWICGQRPVGKDELWELAGVFSTESLAVDACRDERYFVGPVTLDEQLPAETVDWPGCYYPLEPKRVS